MSKELLITVLILRSTICDGKDLVAKKTYDLEEKNAKLLISLGKAKEVDDEVDVDINGVSYNEMTLAELAEVDYKELNKDPLVEYAQACGLEIGNETMKEIYALIETVDFKADEE
ncbi:hypothetical protein CPG37_04560 [Malaciobacter canalis]|uniref:Uncharacterized protein n=1 Tax=Malaciobacter canalis TaxID=1912871 RepID=A0ABX4LQX7_9BACT|nr:hypothetical protein [Malaciobacter canalis]PHO10324.1 hypothetical protein CPG37_04560 [Malaciobacter canalis]QEE32429.1 hypothetical protein ACAN_0940 [Malaciobacter canalis]